CNVRPDRSQRCLSTAAGGVADLHADDHRVLGEVWKYLRIVDPYAASVFDLNLADDAVPRCADRIRNAVRVGPVRQDHTIVDADRESMPACAERAEIVNVRRNQAAIGSDLFVVDPDGSFPVRTFESEHYAASGHVALDLDVVLIPRCANIVTRRLRQKRNFYPAALCRIRFVVVAQVPVAIVKREHPWRFGGDVEAENVLRLKNAGQLDGAAQFPAEPLLLNSAVKRIQLKTPVAVE